MRRTFLRHSKIRKSGLSGLKGMEIYDSGLCESVLPPEVLLVTYPPGARKQPFLCSSVTQDFQTVHQGREIAQGRPELFNKSLLRRARCNTNVFFESFTETEQVISPDATHAAVMDITGGPSGGVQSRVEE